MASTYSTDLKLELMATGENAGTWGTKTNTNLNLVQQAIAGVEAIDVASADVTLAMTDASISNARNMVLKFTGTLAANRQVLVPDSIEKFYVVQDATTHGAYTLTFKTVSGTGFTLDEGKIHAAFSDGTNITEIALNTLGGTIGTAQIDANAITTALISDNQITTAKISANSITTGLISDNQIIASKIATGAVGTSQISTNAVTTAKILDANVTKAKIENVGSYKVLGNTTGGATAPQEVSVLDQDNMSSNSNTALATQQSIKAYVDNSVGSISVKQPTWVTVTQSGTVQFSGTTTLTLNNLTIDGTTSNKTDLRGLYIYFHIDQTAYSSSADRHWTATFPDGSTKRVFTFKSRGQSQGSERDAGSLSLVPVNGNTQTTVTITSNSASPGYFQLQGGNFLK